MKIRRINLFGGPGAGKSTLAPYIFHKLKEKQYNVEFVTEFVKSWTYIDRAPKPFDQVYFLGKQSQYEYRSLSNGVDLTVTDSPVLLSAYYAEYYNKDLEIHKPMFQIAREYERQFPFLNIFIHRGNKPYNEKGRYQTKKQAQKLDSFFYDCLARDEIKFFEFDYEEKEDIIWFIEQKVNL